MSDEEVPLEDVLGNRESWGTGLWYEKAAEQRLECRPLFDSVARPASLPASLRSLQEQFVFYTPALLYLYGGFDNAILLDFMEQYKFKCVFHYFHSQTRLFQVLDTPGDSQWNHCLFAVEVVHWLPFREFMQSVVLANRSRGHVICVGSQELEIVDPLAIAGKVVLPEPLPLATVVAFGVNGNKGAVAFGPGTHPLTDPPKVAFHEPQQEAVVYSEALLSGANPHDAVEKWKHENAQG